MLHQKGTSLRISFADNISLCELYPSGKAEINLFFPDEG